MPFKPHMIGQQLECYMLDLYREDYMVGLQPECSLMDPNVWVPDGGTVRTLYFEMTTWRLIVRARTWIHVFGL